MYLCYMDESGTSDIPGNTSHFVLAGLSVPIGLWKDYDGQIQAIKRKYDLENCEIHAAWILRPYLEQTQIVDFEALSYRQRSSQVNSLRTAELLRLQRAGNPKLYKQTRKNFQKTASYIHLTYGERQQLTKEIALCLAEWSTARLFCRVCR